MWSHSYSVGVQACQHWHLHTRHTCTHTHNPALGAQVDPLQEKWVKMERRKRFNHFPLMVRLSPERLKWEHGALPTAPDCALNHVPRKSHSLHDTERSQLTDRAERVYDHNLSVFMEHHCRRFHLECFTSVRKVWKSLVCSFCFKSKPHRKREQEFKLWLLFSVQSDKLTEGCVLN